MIAPYLWVLTHIISSIVVVIGGFRLYVTFLPLILLLTFFVYYTKPVTYDLVFYYSYFLQPYPSYEPLFYYISHIFSYFNSEIITHIIFTLIAVVIYNFSLRLIGFKTVNVLFTLPVYFNSIFFLLGSQNAVRQFISANLLILALIFVINKIKIKNTTRFFSLINISNLLIYIAIVLVSSLFHWSGLFFGGIIILCLLFDFKKKFHTFTLVLISLILILLLRSLETYGIYIDSSIDWGEERTSNYFKAFVITTYLVLTTFLISKNFLMSNTFFYEIHLLRLNYAIFILPFSLLTGEGFARLLFFFYAVDILYVMSVFLLKRKSIRERIALSFSFLFYGISSNAINILKQAVGSS